MFDDEFLPCSFFNPWAGEKKVGIILFLSLFFNRGNFLFRDEWKSLNPSIDKKEILWLDASIEKKKLSFNLL